MTGMCVKLTFVDVCEVEMILVMMEKISPKGRAFDYKTESSSMNCKFIKKEHNEINPATARLYLHKYST